MGRGNARYYAINDVVSFISSRAPAEGEYLIQSPFTGPRFDRELVDRALELLHAKGRYLDLSAYDLKGTKRLWNDGRISRNLARKATKNLLYVKRAIAGKLRTPARPWESVLPNITNTDFRNLSINRYGTTMGGLLKSYENSPYTALMDLIDHDDEFKEFRDLQPYDMKIVPQNTWTLAKDCKNCVLARKTTKLLLKAKREENPSTPLEQLLTRIGTADFTNVPINKYQTTLGSMLQNVYGNSPYAALKDLIDHDNELEAYRDLRPYHMQIVPTNTWTLEDGSKNWTLGRDLTKQLARAKSGATVDTADILAAVSHKDFDHRKITRYGAKLGGMFQALYDGNTSTAINDLLKNDPDLQQELVLETE